MRRELLEQLDVGDEPRAGEDPFEQVVAQQAVLGHASGQGRFEGVDLVDALAGVGAFAEQILIDIGDGGGIGVDAGRPGEDALVERPETIGGHRGRDARLQHGVSVDDAARAGVERGPVEGMRHRPDQAAGGVPRQTGIGIERDHVANGGGHDGRAPTRGHERRVVGPPEKPVELVEFPALALPPHPRALPLVPDSSAVEQEKALTAGGRGTVAPVEARDPLGRRGEEPIVVRHRLRGRVGPVGEEGEAEVAVRIGQEVDLQAIDVLFDLALVRQQGRHHDEGSQIRREAVAQLEARQRAAGRGCP